MRTSFAVLLVFLQGIEEMHILAHIRRLALAAVITITLPNPTYALDGPIEMSIGELYEISEIVATVECIRDCISTTPYDRDSVTLQVDSVFKGQLENEIALTVRSPIPAFGVSCCISGGKYLVFLNVTPSGGLMPSHGHRSIIRVFARNEHG